MKIKFGFSTTHIERELVSDEYLQINNCGMLVNEKLTRSDRTPRADYMMIYLFDGSGYLSQNGIKTAITAGDMFILKPGAPLNFGFEDESQHYWMHFTGTAVENILSKCGIFETGIFHIGTSSTICDLIHDIYFQFSITDPTDSLLCNGTFLQLFGKIGKIINASNEKTISGDSKIYPAIRDMKLYYYKKHNLGYYANLCNLSISRFQHIFVKETLLTPQAYITSIRMTHAQSLLEYSHTTVKEIAYKVGYDDPLYFSRVFKKTFGISPTEYIQKMKK